MKLIIKKYLLLLLLLLLLLILTLIKLETKENFTNIIDIPSNGQEVTTAYVINLDKRPDRWEGIQKRFYNSSINLKRVSAVEHSNGNIGCAFSFLKIVQMAKDNNLPSILIFEDDNKPMDNFDLRWKVAKRWLDNNSDKWEIINGGARLYDWFKYDINTTSSEHEEQTEYIFSLEENVHFFKTEKLLSTNWVYINSNAYDKVLAWSHKTHGAIDDYLNKTKNFNVLFILPLLGMQVNSFSDTDNRNNNYEITDLKITEIYNKILTKFNIFN